MKSFEIKKQRNKNTDQTHIGKAHPTNSFNFFTTPVLPQKCLRKETSIRRILRTLGTDWNLITKLARI